MDNYRSGTARSSSLLQVVDERPDPAPTAEDRRQRVTRRAGIGLGGLVFALILVGQGIFLVNSLKGGAIFPGTTSAVPRSGSMRHRLDVTLSRVLGPSDRGRQRFQILHINSLPHSRDTTVVITWAINRDLSGGTVGNGAQAEVYSMLRAIYSSHLPIGLVRLDGTYRLRSAGADQVVMRLSMDRRTARLVKNMGWDTVDPQTLWPLVRRLYVNPYLQPQSAE